MLNYNQKFLFRHCLFLITVLAIIQSCQCSSKPNPDYAPLPINGWGEKYYTSNNKPIESKKWAYYYRRAYYRNGKPDPDSLAIDYYLSGEKKSEGYLISENPVKYDGERIDYYHGGAFERQCYNNGVPVGKWRFYLDDGSLFSVTEYNNGVRKKFTQFNKNGKKEREGFFKNDVFYQDIYYYPNGRIDRKNTYEDSQQNSFISEGYYESGRIKFKGRFVKAPDFATSHIYKTVGDVYNYDEKGRLTITNNDPKPIVPKTITVTSKQRSSTWDRGYDYGWDAGYEDAVNGNGMWASYNDSGKGGDFLNGYTSGYEDGYANGRDERRRDNDDEDEEY